MAGRTLGLILDRTVRRVGDDGELGHPEPLSAYRATPAYVLLGDPGAGKTTAFRKEVSNSSDRALFVSARDFLTLDPESHPEWRDRTLFIDGLDEVRAGQGDARTRLDAIRARFDRLRPPGFRMSCRDADWLGPNDAEHLKQVSPGGALTVLHLNPLTSRAVHEVVSRSGGIPDPEAFLQGARDHGLETLLGNPQTLDLLVKAFGASGQWPDTRQETFERGLEQVARETNDEHQIGAPAVPLPDLLVAAGRISAVHLLSAGDRHCLSEADAQTGDVPISAYGEGSRAAAAAALRTRLFTSPAPRRFEPVHANFAAFLAARTLAARLHDGLPRGRVLALLAGDDGVPPTSLRGLAAWLAVFSPELRRPLIERDPAAVLMYGDVQDFTAKEKDLLLHEIASDPARLHDVRWPASALAGLASDEMEETLGAVLRDPRSGDGQEQVVELTAAALCRGPARPGLAEALRGVWQDADRGPRVRRVALDAWMHTVSEQPDRAERLRAALTALGHEEGSDPDHELRGTLLQKLYPGDIEPGVIWNHLLPRSSSIVNRFDAFWRNLPESCPPADFPAHMDQVAATIGSLPGPLPGSVEALPIRLLARALEEHGEQTDPARLRRWLQAGLDARRRAPLGPSDPAALNRVREWLEQRPETLWAVIRVVLREEESGTPGALNHRLHALLGHAALPEDLDRRHLDEAVEAGKERVGQAHLLGLVGALIRNPARADAGLVEARKRLAGQPKKLRFLDGLLRQPVTPNHLRTMSTSRSLEERNRQAKTRLLEAVRSQQRDLRANRAFPPLLHELARHYHEFRRSSGASGARTRLRELLAGDAKLTDTVVEAMRNAIERDDLPSTTDLVRIRRRNQMSFFVGPVLIGLEDRAPEEIPGFGEHRLGAALACRLLEPGLAPEAAWYKRCVQKRPGLVADVLVLVGRALLASGAPIPDAHQLVRDPVHTAVARKATLPLLKAFPVRARAEQFSTLDGLLCSALESATHEPFGASFRQLLGKKLRSRSMTAGQRTRWLAAALLLDSGAFLPELDTNVGGSAIRIRGLAAFLQRVPRLSDRLDAPVAEFLIRTLGPDALPPPINKPYAVLAESRLTGRLIRGLAARPDAAAGTALNRLLQDPALARWANQIEDARDAQRVVRRDAAFTPPPPAAVIAALRDGPPVSAADLRALVTDRLRGISDELRTTNANLWRQFWNEDSDSRKPKPENACRDALLALLRPRLPPGCDAQPEGQYAANRRADLRVASGEWNVPVEIKKDSHRDVWCGVQDQLLPRYANDPATEGLGIYLVLWFGPEHRAPVAGGPRRRSAGELRDRLLAGMTPKERRRATIIVMDVTPP